VRSAGTCSRVGRQNQEAHHNPKHFCNNQQIKTDLSQHFVPARGNFLIKVTLHTCRRRFDCPVNVQDLFLFYDYLHGEENYNSKPDQLWPEKTTEFTTFRMT
jgi:hypothetical protein